MKLIVKVVASTDGETVDASALRPSDLRALLDAEIDEMCEALGCARTAQRGATVKTFVLWKLGIAT